MFMVRVHLAVQLQLPVSPFLALEDDGDQRSLGVSVLKWMSMTQCLQPDIHASLFWGSMHPKQRRVEIWCEKNKPTAAYHRNWETICSLNIKPGLSKLDIPPTAN